MQTFNSSFSELEQLQLSVGSYPSFSVIHRPRPSCIVSPLELRESFATVNSCNIVTHLLTQSHWSLHRMGVTTLITAIDINRTPVSKTMPRVYEWSQSRLSSAVFSFRKLGYCPSCCSLVSRYLTIYETHLFTSNSSVHFSHSCNMHPAIPAMAAH